MDDAQPKREYHVVLAIGSMVSDMHIQARNIAHLWHIIDDLYYSEMQRSAVLSVDIEEVVHKA